MAVHTREAASERFGLVTSHPTSRGHHVVDDWHRRRHLVSDRGGHTWTYDPEERTWVDVLLRYLLPRVLGHRRLPQADGTSGSGLRPAVIPRARNGWHARSYAPSFLRPPSAFRPDARSGSSERGRTTTKGMSAVLRTGEVGGILPVLRSKAEDVMCRGPCRVVGIA